MKEIVRATVLAVIALLLLLLSGCATFKRNHLPAVGDWEEVAPDAYRPSVSCTFEARNTFGGMTAEFVRKSGEEEFIKTLIRSGRFATVATNSPNADLQLEVKLMDRSTPAAIIPAIITGLSLYTIPSWVTDSYEVTAAVTARTGASKTYELKDAGTTVQWLPMVLAFPFGCPFKVHPDIRKNIYMNLVMRMQEDALLSDMTKEQGAESTE